MKTDIQIAQEAQMLPIGQVASMAGIDENLLEYYGKVKAKIDITPLRNVPRKGKLILVTAINPTPAGEGKTTTSVGLADALRRMDKNVMLCLREPSLGPVFGVKGGAAGGGYAQVVPMEDINLHFTGDFHAIGAANNLLAAMLDNHIQQGNALGIDVKKITWRRCVDMNDRQLRNIVDGLGGRMQGVPREDGFDITVASEVMAIFCLATSITDLKERLGRMLGEEVAQDVWASTFHSACVRILRRDIDRIGFDRSFTIYDTDDSKRVIKDILKELSLDEKAFPTRELLSIISRAKDEMQSPEEFIQQWQAINDWRRIRIGKVYALYNKKLCDANALDFDDIILHTVRLLQSCPDVRSYYQNKFRYILIDEYQDTNHLQYLLASLLTNRQRNICVVGDDDQSIYRFRGADISNILSFEKEYQGARTIRLEQNYRSTQNILDAANAVIRHNEGRKGKTLWTDNGAGEKVVIKTAFNESDEANYVVGQIMMSYRRGGSWKDNAVLYRMNAQSNALEYAFKRNGVPYKIYGGMKFFDRAEVKDMLAYLCVISNTADDLRLRRIVNVPSRKIGQATVDKAQLIATEQGSALYDVFRRAADYPELKNAAGKLLTFTDMIESLRRQIEGLSLIHISEPTRP